MATRSALARWQGKLIAPQLQNLVAYIQTLTTAVPGQVVATPVHEELMQAATVVAQAKLE